MTDMMDYMKAIVMIQLFFSFGITIVVYTLPKDLKVHINPFSDTAGEIDFEGVATDLDDSLQRQRDIPVIDIGALVFYSGNILIDLLLNFITAIPQMIGLLIFGMGQIVGLGIDNYMMATLELFVFVTVTALYVLSIIQLVTSYRGRGSLV